MRSGTTRFVVDAQINGAYQALDKLEQKEQKVKEGFVAIGREADRAAIAVATAGGRMARASGPPAPLGGAYLPAGRTSSGYGVKPAAAAAVTPTRFGAPAVAPSGADHGFGYSVAGVDGPGAHYQHRLAADPVFADAERERFRLSSLAAGDPTASRLKAEAVAAQVRAESARKRAASAALQKQIDAEVAGVAAQYEAGQRERFRVASLAAGDPTASRLAAEAVAKQVREASAAKRSAALQHQADFDVQLTATSYQYKERLKAEQSARNKRDLAAGGAMAATAGVYAATSFAADLSEASARNVEFANDFRKVASLGDNVGRIGAKRDQVLKLSTGYGVATEQVTAAIYDVESAASNLSDEDQAEMMRGGFEFNRLQGTDPGVGAKAILKYKEIYGDRLKNVNQAKNRLFATADKGDLEIEAFAKLAPDLLSRGKAMNVDDTTVLAQSIVATQKLGRTEKTLTSQGDVYMKMPDAAKKLGVELKGTLADLDKLAKFSPEQLVDAFGTEVGMIRVLVDNRKQIAALKTELEGIGPTADAVGEKLRKLTADPNINAAQRAAIDEQALRNQPLTADYQAKWGGFEENQRLAKLNVRDKLGPAMNWLADPLSYVLGGAEYAVGGDSMATAGREIRNRSLTWEQRDELYNPGDKTELVRMGRRPGEAASPGEIEARKSAAAATNAAAQNLKTATRGALQTNAHVE